METPSRETIITQVRTLQIIVAALIVGCLTFAGIAVFIGGQREPAGADQVENQFPIITVMALAFGAVALIAQAVIVPMLRKQSLQRLAKQPEAAEVDAAQLLVSLQSTTIVGAAISEGACFFNLIAHLMEGSPYSLLMASVLVLTIVMRFPTVNGVIDWLDRQMRLVREEREFGRRG